MNIVLIEPQIPQNTGNIARICAATGSPLHLVGKLGFKTDDKHLKRAGLDYWQYLDISYYDNFGNFERQVSGTGHFYFITTRGNKVYAEVSFKADDYLIFGSETSGLPETLRSRPGDCYLRIPMIEEARSLNLANSVGIVLYEALRQGGFVNCQPFP
ncbi:MAG: tRNA (cytidine(34)-2'-O)-methyltransferase [Proteobacteria bacterium]|nr:tRNA (cytidine(34)-2'-O)-methyltransferase [Pseudomonadota bacterium]